MVLQYFAANPNVNQTLTQDGDFHYFNNSANGNIKKFQNSFKLPFAGYRAHWNAVSYDQSYGGDYWSSSPRSENSTYARFLYMDSSTVQAHNLDFRTYGYSVRCFKDHPDAPATLTITFNQNGGNLLGAEG